MLLKHIKGHLAEYIGMAIQIHWHSVIFHICFISKTLLTALLPLQNNSMLSTSSLTRFHIVYSLLSISYTSNILSDPLLHESTISVISVSIPSLLFHTSDGHLHLVELFRTLTYHPMVPFPQSVTDNQMETDWVGDVGGKRCNLKERIPK
jgi:hypothetical protein